MGEYVNIAEGDPAVVKELELRLLETFNDFKDEMDARPGRRLSYASGLMGFLSAFVDAIRCAEDGISEDLRREKVTRIAMVHTLARALGVDV